MLANLKILRGTSDGPAKLHDISDLSLVLNPLTRGWEIGFGAHVTNYGDAVATWGGGAASPILWLDGELRLMRGVAVLDSIPLNLKITGGIPNIALIKQATVFTGQDPLWILIAITALAGVTAYALRHDIRYAHAALVGIPATVGALGGATLQQRLSARSLTLAFAALLVAIGVWLIAG